MGNGEAKEFICMIHGHELGWGNDGEWAVTGQRGIKGREKWGNCNSIINKRYFNFFKKENTEKGKLGQSENSGRTCRLGKGKAERTA